MPLMWEDLQEAPSRSDRWKATLRKQPSAFLLAVQILVILLLPVLESSSWGAAVISLLSLSALITAVFTVRSTPALTWLSATLALPAAVFEIWSLIDAGARIYVCGDGSRMEPDVKRALTRIYAEEKDVDPAEADAWMERMGAENRYVLDVWSGN